MAAFLHHCPFLKSVPKPALRRMGTALLSTAHRCPIIIRQISVSSVTLPVDDCSISPAKPEADQRRLFSQVSPQVDLSAPKGCPFVTSRIGMVKASSEVQEDIQEGKVNQNTDRNRAKCVGVAANICSFTGLLSSILKGLKDPTLPGSAQVTHLLKDNMGESYTQTRREAE